MVEDERWRAGRERRSLVDGLSRKKGIVQDKKRTCGDCRACEGGRGRIPLWMALGGLGVERRNLVESLGRKKGRV